jgi:hypothetical protein
VSSIESVSAPIVSYAAVSPVFPWRILMLFRRRVPCFVVIGILMLGATGCGGGVPTTGDSLKEAPDTAARGKAMADGYMKKAASQKGQDRVKTAELPK